MTAVIYFVMAWLIGLLLQSLVQRKRIKAIAAAVVLTLFGMLGYVSTMLSDTDTDATAEAADQSSVPPAFQALNGKNVAVIIGSIQDIAVTEERQGGRGGQ